MRMRPTLFAVVAGMCAMLLAAGALAASAARQRDATYPPGSPQATVSAYLHLLQDGQVDRAYALVSPSMGMTAGDFHQQYDGWDERPHRATLVRSWASGTSASVTADIATFSAGPFGASDSIERETFTLVRERGAWRIVGPEYLY